jgi:hypothetical protein
MLTDFMADEMQRDYGKNGKKRNKQKNAKLDFSVCSVYFRFFRNLSASS